MFEEEDNYTSVTEGREHSLQNIEYVNRVEAKFPRQELHQKPAYKSDGKEGDNINVLQALFRAVQVEQKDRKRKYGHYPSERVCGEKH